MLNHGVRQHGCRTHAGGDPHVPEMRQRRDSKVSWQETVFQCYSREKLVRIRKSSDGASAHVNKAKSPKQEQQR